MSLALTTPRAHHCAGTGVALNSAFVYSHAAAPRMLLRLAVCCVLPLYAAAQLPNCVLGGHDGEKPVIWLDAAGIRYYMNQYTVGYPPAEFLTVSWHDHAHNVTANNGGACFYDSCRSGNMCLVYNDEGCMYHDDLEFVFETDEPCDIISFTQPHHPETNPFQWTRFVPPSGTPTPSFSPAVSLPPSASFAPSVSPSPPPASAPAAAAANNTNIYTFIGAGAGAAALLCAGGWGVAIFFYTRMQTKAESQYKELPMSTLN